MTHRILFLFFMMSFLSYVTNTFATPSAHSLHLPEKLTISNTAFDKFHQFQKTQQQRLKNLSLDTKQLTFADNNTNNEINFLDLQLTDALNFIISVRSAAISTRSILLSLQKPASTVATGSYSQDDIDYQNEIFQKTIEILGYIQHVDLYDGEKIVSGGSIHLSFEDNSGRHDTYNITLPAFDTHALSLDKLNVLSQTNAEHALTTLQASLKIVERDIVQMDNDIDDLEALIISIPSVLSTDHVILMRMLEVAVQAANDPYDINDKALLETQYATLKQEIDKAETIPTLNGPIKMTGGQLRIQVGEATTPDHVLTIRLPNVNIIDLSLDRSHIDTQDNVYASLDTLKNTLHHFVYY